MVFEMGAELSVLTHENMRFGRFKIWKMVGREKLVPQNQNGVHRESPRPSRGPLKIVQKDQLNFDHKIRPKAIGSLLDRNLNAWIAFGRRLEMKVGGNFGGHLKEFCDALIVGAGISGLVLANRLKKSGKTVIVLEKSRGVGGRMATRRDGSASFDHGAQFLKIPLAQDPSGQEVTAFDLSSWNLSLQTWFEDSSFSYLIFPTGLNKIAKTLARGLPIEVNKKVVRISAVEPMDEITSASKKMLTYHVETECGRIFEARQVFLSPPLPQSLALLSDSKIKFPEDLKKIQYAKCLVGLFRVETKSSEIRNFDYKRMDKSEIQFISNQFSKKVSEDLAFTVAMAPTWSEENFDEPEMILLEKVEHVFRDFLQQIDRNFTIERSQMKKWRYSHPQILYPKPYIEIDPFGQIVLFGDAFSGGDIPGAFMSAISIPLNSLKE
jgi:renalase